MANKAAAWVQESGTLSVSVFLPTESTQEIAGGSEVVLSFTLQNPSHAQSSATVSLSVVLQDTPTMNDGYDDPYHAPATHDSSSIVVPGSDTTAVSTSGKDACNNSPQNGDADPLRVRAVSFTSFSVEQNSANPCADNEITVKFTTDGPLFQNCVSNLTLSGLSGSVTADQSLSLSSVPSGVIEPYGPWTNVGGSAAGWDNTGAAGTLLLPLAAGGLSSVVKGCQEYVIVFALKNPATPQGAAAVTLNIARVIDNPAISALAGSAIDPMQIDALTWSTKSISDTNTYPCFENVITLTIQPDVDLYASCVEYLEFSGFTGSMTGSSSLSIVDDSSTFNKTASWSMSSGILQVFLVGTMSKDTKYTISFTIRNGKEPQVAQDSIAINAPLLSSTNQQVMVGSVLQILEPTWAVSISSSSKNPCASNSISISVAPATAPIAKFCDSKITVRGIKGSATVDQEITGVVAATGGFSETAGWEYVEGVLLLELDSDLAVDTTYTYSFDVLNQPTKNSAQTITFINPSVFGSGKSDKLVGPENFIMQIDALEITGASAIQTLHWPCALNTITVIFTTNIALLSGCRYGDSYASQHATAPKITLSGLTGTREGSAVSATTSTDTPNPLHGLQPDLTVSTGEFIITPSESMGIGTHTFSFEVTNQEESHTAPSLV